MSLVICTLISSRKDSPLPISFFFFTVRAIYAYLCRCAENDTCACTCNSVIPILGELKDPRPWMRFVIKAPCRVFSRCELRWRYSSPSTRITIGSNYNMKELSHRRNQPRSSWDTYTRKRSLYRLDPHAVKTADRELTEGCCKCRTFRSNFNSSYSCCLSFRLIRCLSPGRHSRGK